MNNYIAFDIETASLDFETLSHSQQEYLLRGATSEEEIAKKKYEMGLSPFTAQVVCIGLMKIEVDNDKNEVITKLALSCDNAMNDDEKNEIELSHGDRCIITNEKMLLKKFWSILSKNNTHTLLSFNGRNFDAPFLMLRSALKEVRPSKNLMQGTKFNYAGHIDLIDELTYYNGSQTGATRRFNFDYYTQAFGIKSPKSEGVDGSMVSTMFYDGNIAAISDYCLRDITATWELYKKWDMYLRF
ncbi:MAG TPA: ribonuclease H-like domain-containing protein [Candidatus Kapabacteria bacterium]|nr:ribonuclease H-like domain-containing protein [Candidatus Kapabacteria bacterium]